MASRLSGRASSVAGRCGWLPIRSVIIVGNDPAISGNRPLVWGVTHHGGMRRGWRVLAWIGGAVAGLGCTVVGVLLYRAGLEDADRWASVIGMSITVISFPLSVYGIVLARRAAAAGTTSAEVQVTATGTRSIAAYNMSGSASTGNGAATPPEPRPADPTPAPGGHSDTATAGPVSPATTRIEASGERSIAAHTISGSASTGDNPPGTQ